MLPKLRIIRTENIFKQLLPYEDINTKYKPLKFDIDNTCSAFDDRLDIKIPCMNWVCFCLHINTF